MRTVFTDEDREAQDFLGSKHAVNTADNVRTMTFAVKVAEPGRHVLKVAMVDPTLVLQSIAVSSGKPRKSYFGPVPVRRG